MLGLKRKKKKELSLCGYNDNHRAASLASRPSHCINTFLVDHNRPSTPPKHNQVFPFHVQASSEVRFIALIRSCPFLLRELDFWTVDCVRVSIFHLVFLIPCWLGPAMLFLDPQCSCLGKNAPCACINKREGFHHINILEGHIKYLV